MWNKKGQIMNERRYRNRQINFRVTDDEYKVLYKKANRHGMSMTKYIREMLIYANEQPLPTIDITPLLSISHELKKQGTNLNQLMHFLNANGIKGYNEHEVRRVLGFKGEAYLKVANAIGDLRDEASQHRITLLMNEPDEDE